MFCRLLDESNTESTVLALQKQLHEKDLRLTDIQLEALSSAHQLQQLQGTINRMKVGTFNFRDSIYWQLMVFFIKLI